MEILYRRYRVEALSFARSLVRSGYDAEDALHEAFTKTISAMANGYGPSENFRAYLYTAIRATVAGTWKKNSRDLLMDVYGLDTSRRPVTDERFDRVLEAAAGERVITALQSLPARWQTVLWYSEVLREPPRRIAPLMGIAPNAVSALVRRARTGLRTAYRDVE